jgi:anion-transporting  ArsA/GET3 family ATPase
MLSTPDTFGDIAPGGAIRRQAYKVRDMLRDPKRTGFVAVSSPEEMPINETLQLQDKVVGAVGRELDAIIVNGLFPERFKAAEVDTLQRLGANSAVDAALASDGRAREQRTHLRRLRKDARAPVVTLPYLFRPQLDLDAYRNLGSRLAKRV